MRIHEMALISVAVAVPLLGQPARSIRPVRPSVHADSAEMAIKQAGEQLGRMKKIYDRDLEVLRHLRIADEALRDPMQPAIALQKGYEEIGKAEALVPEFLVMQGVTRARQELGEARRSPGTADFERLRGLLQREAMGPAVRVVLRNGIALQEETMIWFKVQELITGHLRVLSEITAESLRASQQ